MRWKFMHTTCIALCIFGSLFELQAQDTCEVIIEEQYQQVNFEKCLDFANICHWRDRSIELPIIGHATYQTHQYVLSKNFLLTSLEKGASSVLDLNLLARIYEKDWNFPQAIKYSRLFLQKDSTNASEWYRRGTTTLKAKLYPCAFTAFTKVLELNSQYYQARVKVVDSLIRQEQLLQTAKLLEVGWIRDAGNVLLLLESGRSWYNALFAKNRTRNLKSYEHIK